MSGKLKRRAYYKRQLGIYRAALAAASSTLVFPSSGRWAMIELTQLARDNIREGKPLKGRCGHINEVPACILKARDRWRRFWRWFPLLSVLMRRRYERRLNAWCREQEVILISH